MPEWSFRLPEPGPFITGSVKPAHSAGGTVSLGPGTGPSDTVGPVMPWYGYVWWWAGNGVMGVVRVMGTGCGNGQRALPAGVVYGPVGA